MKTNKIVLGVIADTHIPDKSPGLHAGIADTFQQAGVSLIIHAGDISVPGVLRRLEAIAPVAAVRGNRDWLMYFRLPAKLTLTYYGCVIGIFHGHGGIKDYILGKLLTLRHPERYPFRHYRRIAKSTFPKAKIIIFGHSHMPENRWIEGTLYFNPGSARTRRKDSPPSIGLITIAPGGKITSEIILLEN